MQHTVIRIAVAGVATPLEWWQPALSHRACPAPGRRGVVFDWIGDLYWPDDVGGQLLRDLHRQDERTLTGPRAGT